MFTKYYFLFLFFIKDQNVKLIRELKSEIDTLKKSAVSVLLFFLVLYPNRYPLVKMLKSNFGGVSLC